MSIKLHLAGVTTTRCCPLLPPDLLTEGSVSASCEDAMASYMGSCFCGSVKLDATGAPEVKGEPIRSLNTMPQPFTGSL